MPFTAEFAQRRARRISVHLSAVTTAKGGADLHEGVSESSLHKARQGTLVACFPTAKACCAVRIACRGHGWRRVQLAWRCAEDVAARPIAHPLAGPWLGLAHGLTDCRPQHQQSACWHGRQLFDRTGRRVRCAESRATAGSVGCRSCSEISRSSLVR